MVADVYAKVTVFLLIEGYTDYRFKNKKLRILRGFSHTTNSGIKKPATFVAGLILSNLNFLKFPGEMGYYRNGLHLNN